MTHTASRKPFDRLSGCAAYIFHATSGGLRETRSVDAKRRISEKGSCRF